MHLCVATSPYCDTVNGSFNQLQFIWWYYFSMDNCGNSRAIYAEKPRLLEGVYS